MIITYLKINDKITTADKVNLKVQVADCTRKGKNWIGVQKKPEKTPVSVL